MIDSFIYSNGISTRLGLFYDNKSENHVHIYIFCGFLVSFLLTVFYE